MNKHGQTFTDVLEAHATEHPDDRAFGFLNDPEHAFVELSYATLHKRACAVAALLRSAGVEKGIPVVLLCSTGPELVSALFGCFYAGAIAVPASDPHRLNRTSSRLSSICRDVGARFGLTTSSVAAQLARARTAKHSINWLTIDTLTDAESTFNGPPRSTPDSLAVIQYTSGSTSRPKGVALTHRNLLYNQELIREAVQQSKESIFVGWLPAYHDMGLIGLILHPVYLGAQSILMPTMTFLRRPFRWLEAMSRYRATATAAPNFAFDLCVERTSETQRLSLDLSSLQAVVNGAEPVRKETLDRFTNAFAACGFKREAFYPSYGLGEATLLVSGRRELADNLPDSLEVQSSAARVVSCGRPATGLEVVIVDPKTSSIRPEGNIGEIWIRGDSVGSGYWNKPRQSARVFQARLASGNEKGYLRTGDLGFLRRGCLFVSGRQSDLIIIRGRNIHPEDIERTAEKSPAKILPHACAAFSVDALDGVRIVLVQEVRSGSNYSEIATALRREVSSEHDVEVYSVVLVRPNQIPRTSSGKIRRKACREAFSLGKLRELFRSDLGFADKRLPDPVGAPGDSIEETLRQILSDLLRVSAAEIDRDQQVFNLGLDSLKAVQFQQCIEDRFGVTVLTSDLFTAKVKDVAEAIARGSATRSVASLLSTTDQKALYRMTSGQVALWFEYERNPTSSAYQVGGAIQIRGSLHTATLAFAFDALLQRHAVLRTRSEVTRSGPWQTVNSQSALALETHDASTFTTDELLETLRREFNRPFDLKAEAPVRLQVYQITESDWVLLFTAHHIVADLRSLEVLTSELSELYRMAVAGVSARLEQSASYADYAEWHEQMLCSPVGKDLVTFWQTELAGDVPLLALSQKSERADMTLRRGALRQRSFSPSLLSAIEAVARRENITRFVLLLAAFKILLYRYTQQTDMAVGTPATVRPHCFRNTVGYCVNLIALRSEMRGDDTCRAYLHRLQKKTLLALDHCAYPFSRLVQERRGAGITDAITEMPIVFNYYGNGSEAPALALQQPNMKINWTDCDAQTIRVERANCQFDLSFSVGQCNDTLAASVEYCADLFEEGFIDRLLDHFEVVLTDLLRDPAKQIAQLSTLTEAEYAELDRWNDTTVKYTDVHVLHALFEKQARLRPHAIAVTDEAQSLTYAELDRKSTSLAVFLVDRGAGAGRPVAVILPPGAKMVVSLLAILKGGAAYIPIDPLHGPERIEGILQQAAPALVLTTRASLAANKEIHPTVFLDEIELEPGTAETGAPLPEVRPGDLAYIMHTSGSTGEPKGVMISHEAICNRLIWMRDHYRPSQTDRVLQKTPYTFDVSVWEIFLPLISGIEMVIVRPGGYRDPNYLIDLIQRRQITILHFVPSMLQMFLEAPGVEKCASLRLVICSGEALLPALRDRFHAIAAAAELHNLYGPTEAAVDVTQYACDRSDTENTISIGRPISNIKVYILDPYLNPVPVGVTGQLYIAGTGLAQGYWRRPDLTDAVFVPISVGTDAPVRAYATGDRARYRSDGNIEFLGRQDEQVKINGVRVELADVETALRRHPAISNCVVTSHDANGHGLQLAAYIVVDANPPSANELRAFLSRKLPTQFIPSVVCVLDSLPTTSSGKLKRKGLPAPSLCRQLARKECQQPETAVESLLVRIWREVLALEQVGTTENFFELGGDSIRLLQVRNRALQHGYGFEIDDLFRNPTIRELTPSLRVTAKQAPGSITPPFSLVSPEIRDQLEPHFDDAFPLTKTQEALLFHSEREGNYEVYVLSITLTGVFHEQLFKDALAAIVARHPMLRVAYNCYDFDEFLQIVHREVTVPMEVIELTAHTAGEQEEIIERCIRSETHHNFDWTTPPLLRIQVHRRSARSFQLTVSHALYDGWSLSSALVELLSEYAARVVGAPSPLPVAPTASYRDFVAAEQAAINDPACGKFWRERLVGLPPTYLYGNPGEVVNANGSGRQRVIIPSPIATGLRQLAKSAQAPLKSVLLGLHLRVISHLTGRREVATGLITNGRLDQPDGDRVVGLFLNTVPLQMRFEGQSWRDIVHQTFQKEREIWPFRRYPLSEMRALLGTMPFNTAFNYIDFHVYNQLRETDGLQVTAWKNPSDNTYFPLCAYFTKDPIASRLLFYLDYDRTLFDSVEIETIVRYYEKAFELAATRPEAVAAAEELCLDSETAPIGTCVRSAQTAHQLFEEWAVRTPDVPAIRSGTSNLSYAELNSSANRLARRLRKLGLKSEEPVGVMLDRTPQLVIAILGIMKAGGAFVPLNPSLPHERLEDIKQDCGLRIVIVPESQLVTSRGADTTIELTVDDSDSRQYSAAMNEETTPDALVYVMYTSGSTGRPKGVEITHGSLLNVLESVGSEIAITARDKWLALTSISFDISVLELLLPLIRGAQIEMADAVTSRDGSALTELLVNSKATIMQATPSTWRLILEAGWTGSSRLRILCGGERLPRQLANDLLGRCVALWNMYGPTETTIWSSIARVVREDEDPTIGRALANTTLYVLDDARKQVPDQSPGELYIGGRGVARGYRNRSEETASRFLPDPFAADANARMYRTGDKVRRRSDGSLEFLGRLDGQIKIRGHRIELGEIESVLRSHPSLCEAVVTVRRHGNDDARLVAYVLPALRRTPNVVELKAYLARLLPPYTVPAEVIPVTSFPLNANGKIDRHALPYEGTITHAARKRQSASAGVESFISEIWRDLLDKEDIDRHDNLFHLGAHSLLVMRFCMRIKKELNLACGPSEVFSYPTIASLAAYLERDPDTHSSVGDSGQATHVLGLDAIIARRKSAWAIDAAVSPAE